jgi:hypothetical protein
MMHEWPKASSTTKDRVHVVAEVGPRVAVDLKRSYFQGKREHHVEVLEDLPEE